MKKQKAEADFYATCKKAKALAPRIAELLKVAKALCDNNFPLGEDKYRNLETIPEFIANGYSELGIVCIMFGKTHRGQIVNSDIVRGIGFTRCGGNSSSIYINADGELLVWGSGKPFDYHLRFGRIVDLFEEFETKFYEYVDSL